MDLQPSFALKMVKGKDEMKDIKKETPQNNTKKMMDLMARVNLQSKSRKCCSKALNLSERPLWLKKKTDGKSVGEQLIKLT
jgi:hypothetical protein